MLTASDSYICPQRRSLLLGLDNARYAAYHTALNACYLLGLDIETLVWLCMRYTGWFW